MDYDFWETSHTVKDASKFEYDEEFIGSID